MKLVEAAAGHPPLTAFSAFNVMHCKSVNVSRDESDSVASLSHCRAAAPTPVEEQNAVLL